jgi:hypothetical protein
MTAKDEEVFKRLADSYVERYGADLLSEQRALEQSGVTVALPRADARVKRLAHERKRKTRTRTLFAAAAACLIMAVGSFAVLDNVPLDSHAPSDSAPPSTAGNAPSSQDTLVPLSFNLPGRFTVASSMLDRGTSIYHLDDEQGDDVVLTIRNASKTPVDTEDTEDLEPITVGDTTVDGKVRNEYKLLVFEHDGLLYTMSCRDSLGTLIELYEHATI